MTALTVIRGDITTQRVDAVVNAANSTLLGGGGVDGAIHRAGGPAILAACRGIRAARGNLPTGHAVATTAGHMPASWVIHTVGPVYTDHAPDTAARLLGDCYTNSLDVAVEMGARTVAFPNISTGVYGYPKPAAADVVVAVVAAWSAADKQLEEIRFVAFDAENHRLYADRLEDG